MPISVEGETAEATTDPSAASRTDALIEEEPTSKPRRRVLFMCGGMVSRIARGVQ